MSHPDSSKIEVGRRRLDENGRLMPMTEAERIARHKARRDARARIEAIPDDEHPVSDEEIFRAIDSHRPHRPLFEGLY